MRSYFDRTEHVVIQVRGCIFPVEPCATIRFSLQKITFRVSWNTQSKAFTHESECSQQGLSPPLVKFDTFADLPSLATLEKIVKISFGALRQVRSAPNLYILRMNMLRLTSLWILPPLRLKAEARILTMVRLCTAAGKRRLKGGAN